MGVTSRSRASSKRRPQDEDAHARAVGPVGQAAFAPEEALSWGWTGRTTPPSAIGKSKVRYKTVRGYKSISGMGNGVALTQWLYDGEDEHDLAKETAA